MNRVNRIFIGLAALVFLGVCGQAKEAFAHQVTIHVKCWGDQRDAKITMKWGHPDIKNDTKLLEVKAGEEKDWVLDIPDNSEFEIQTQGGHGTGYEIHADVAGKGHFSVKFEHGEFKEFEDHDDVHIERSSKGNEFGEVNIRVHIKP